jgi:hypothetical protein
MKISIHIWFNYLKIFEKQDLAVAKARVVDAKVVYSW